MRMRRSWIAAGLALFGTVLTPLAVNACPNCYAASDSRVLLTYYLSTAVLTLLPFAIVGTILLVAVRMKRYAALHADDIALADPPAS